MAAGPGGIEALGKDVMTDCHYSLPDLNEPDDIVIVLNQI